ncbi:hypothetical protein AK812_SmicGene27045 [Symbiodinium microadriaticum]|uniref:F-box domain-containing protein n=1 Tax=Symbiodinium microadriaticum TaxID=2951 RepID=A0A1Q9D7T4_SYMMI|nr:hypothetical protein AK812_SmicGene27045 [Symbiodinium microadriaticum]
MPSALWAVMDNWRDDESEELDLRPVGSGKFVDRFGRAWQRAVWDDDLRAMEEEDVFWRPNFFPAQVFFRVDAPSAPCTIPYQPKQSADLKVDPLHSRSRLAACHLHLGEFLKLILGVNMPQDALLAICALLPLRERRAFSCLARQFRLATTLTWSDDPVENDTTLLSIMRKDQPEFLSRAIKDSGTSKDSLGRILVHATDGGRVYRRHRCCRLLGEMGAEVRCEDAVRVTGGLLGYHDSVYVRKLGKSELEYIGSDSLLALEEPSENLFRRIEQGFKISPDRAAKDKIWCHWDDGGFNLAHVAFSASTVPPSDGWHAEADSPRVIPTIRVQPLRLEDLLYSGPASSGPILDRREVRISFTRPLHWIPASDRSDGQLGDDPEASPLGAEAQAALMLMAPLEE